MYPYLIRVTLLTAFILAMATGRAQTFGLHGGAEYQVFQGDVKATKNSFRPSFGPFMSIWFHSQIEWRTELAISPSGSPYLKGRSSTNPISAGISIPTMVRFYPRPNFILMGGVYYEYWMTHTPASELTGHNSSVTYMNIGPTIGLGIQKNKWDFNIRAEWDAYSFASPDPLFSGQAISGKLVVGKILRSKQRKFTKRRLWTKNYVPGRN